MGFYAEGSASRKGSPETVLSILGPFRPEMGSLRLGMSPIRLQVQPRVKVFSIGVATLRVQLGDDQRTFDRFCPQRDRTRLPGHVLTNS